MKLIEPTIEYKEQAIDYINEFYNYNSKINGTGGLDRYLDNYEEWLIKVAALLLQISGTAAYVFAISFP